MHKTSRTYVSMEQNERVQRNATRDAEAGQYAGTIYKRHLQDIYNKAWDAENARQKQAQEDA